MALLRKFKVTPSVADPEGLFASAIVILLEETVDERYPELPFDIAREMYREAHNVGR